MFKQNWQPPDGTTSVMLYINFISFIPSFFARSDVYIGIQEKKVENIRHQAAASRSGKQRGQMQEWMGLIQDCVSIDRLDRSTAFQRIDNVTVHEQMGVRKPEHSGQIKFCEMLS